MSHACHIHLDRARVSARVVRLVATLTALLLLTLASTSMAAGPRAQVKVIVPDGDNLQLLAFWVARGAGYFESEGVDVELVVPPRPALAQSLFTNGDAPAALLPAPIAERLVSERFPMVIAANLLASDPINLVAPSALVKARGLDRDRPLASRLRALHGLRIGVGPHPRPRLLALFASQGLDAEREVAIVVVRGEEQNEALADGRVDALYTHTPFLENALVDQGAVIVVDQSGGEVPALTNRQIHMLAFTSAFVTKEPRAARGMVQAIARAEELVHRDANAAVDAVLRALPAYDRAHVARLVSIYAPAIPRTPLPSARAIARELAFYPAGDRAPDLSAVDLDRFVAPELSDRPSSRSRRPRAILAIVVAVGLAVALMALLAEREKSRGKAAHDTSV